ncbi:hypothetical protein ACO0LF_28160 [Undibacterium sp. Di27W]
MADISMHGIDYPIIPKPDLQEAIINALDELQYRVEERKLVL